MKRKILVAIDGSDQAMEAVRYISRMFDARNTMVVLLHIQSEVPESFFDLMEEPALRSSVISINSWAAQMNNNIKQTMTDAIQILTDNGFPAESVKVQIQAKKTGIARDILNESMDGYDIIVAGRIGISRIKDLVMGSIATKLIGRIPHIPVVTIGGKPDPKKILIGFDGSEGAIKAVNCIGRLLENSDCEVVLTHVVRPMGTHHGLRKIFNSEEESKWIASNEEKIEPAFLRAEKYLQNSGFSSGQISREIIPKKVSRAAAIAHKAKEEDIGTVVVGRRGLTAIDEFIMGRVSTKVLNMVTKAAVWVV